MRRNGHVILIVVLVLLVGAAVTVIATQEDEPPQIACDNLYASLSATDDRIGFHLRAETPVAGEVKIIGAVFNFGNQVVMFTPETDIEYIFPDPGEYTVTGSLHVEVKGEEVWTSSCERQVVIPSTE